MVRVVPEQLNVMISECNSHFGHSEKHLVRPKRVRVYYRNVFCPLALTCGPVGQWAKSTYSGPKESGYRIDMFCAHLPTCGKVSLSMLQTGEVGCRVTNQSSASTRLPPASFEKENS